MMDNQAGTQPIGTIALDQINLGGQTLTNPADTGAALPIGSDRSLVDVPLDKSQPSKKDKPRVPRRILHFSDGILEEYSTDEEEEKKEPEPTVNPKSLTWGPWFWHYFITAASKLLNTADFCGEKIAWALGITSPKYQYILDEYHRRKKEELKEQMEDEMLVNAKKDPEVVIHEPEIDCFGQGDTKPEKGRL